jgi:Isochorismatase family
VFCGNSTGLLISLECCRCTSAKVSTGLAKLVEISALVVEPPGYSPNTRVIQPELRSLDGIRNGMTVFYSLLADGTRMKSEERMRNLGHKATESNARHQHGFLRRLRSSLLPGLMILCFHLFSIKMPRTALFVIDIQKDLADNSGGEIPTASRIKKAGSEILKRARKASDDSRAKGETPPLNIIFVQHEEPPESGALVRGSEPWKLVFEPRENEAFEKLVAKTDGEIAKIMEI